MSNHLYYFSVTNGAETLVDHHGVALASVDAAREWALTGGQAIVDNLDAVVRVSDADGKLVMAAPLSVTGMVHGAAAGAELREEKRLATVLATARAGLARFIPLYQPKLRLGTGAITGFEAVLHWRHPGRGIETPDEIAEVLDHPDIAAELGREMQAQVFDDIRHWRGKGVAFGRVALNVSPAELLLPNYAEDLLERLRVRRIAPDSLDIEVKETAMTGADSALTVAALRTLKAQGIGVWLDDFGTAYGSLSHLREMPISGVKIDGNFIGDLGEAAEARTIVGAVVGLVRDLELSLVAAGVETEVQSEFLRIAGCETVQGDYYASAMKAEAVAGFVAARVAPEDGKQRKPAAA